MTQILIKGELSDTLAAVNGEVDLVDERGRVLGHFIRVSEAVAWPHAEFPAICEEEIERRRQQKGTWTLAEIWKSLGVTP